MRITGKYEFDANFITVYTEDTMYTIARNSGDGGYIKVGDKTASGLVITQELFDSWKEECQKEGTFEFEIE